MVDTVAVDPQVSGNELGHIGHADSVPIPQATPPYIAFEAGPVNHAQVAIRGHPWSMAK